MKNVFLTATVFATLLLGLNACSKKSDTDNNSKTQLSAKQMLLLGTTNPNDLNARGVYHWDSVHYSLYTQIRDQIWVFTQDSMLVFSSPDTVRTIYYLIEDTISSPAFGSQRYTISFPTTTQLRLGSVSGNDVYSLHYFTKLN